MLENGRDKIYLIKLQVLPYHCRFAVTSSNNSENMDIINWSITAKCILSDQFKKNEISLSIKRSFTWASLAQKVLGADDVHNATRVLVKQSNHSTTSVANQLPKCYSLTSLQPSHVYPLDLGPRPQTALQVKPDYCLMARSKSIWRPAYCGGLFEFKAKCLLSRRYLRKHFASSSSSFCLFALGKNLFTFSLTSRFAITRFCLTQWELC